MKIIPAIDILGGKTVRLEQGRYDRKLSYAISPVEAAQKWEAMGAELLHVVDLDGAKEGRPVNLAIIEEVVRRVAIPVEVGGGFRKENDIKSALTHGAWRVVLGTKAFEDMDFAKSSIENFKEQVILSIDASGFKPQVQGWRKSVEIDVIDVLKKFISFGSQEIIYTDIEKDGMLQGPNMKQLKRILTEVRIKVISSGGIKSLEHITQLKKLEKIGLSGVIIGRALYDGTIDLKEAIDAGKKNNSVS